MRSLAVAVLMTFLGANTSPAVTPAQRAVATFAGGCFWCMEGPFEKLRGVTSATSGYTGGPQKNPTYEQVSSGQTGHAEAVEIVFDPKVITYERLLDVFWHNIDPLSANGQFCDRGSQYRSAIFFHDEAQKRAAEASKAGIEASGRLKGRIVTQILAATPFYRAEDYHQDFYKTNRVRYQMYRMGCGRERRLKEVWGDQAGGMGP